MRFWRKKEAIPPNITLIWSPPTDRLIKFRDQPEFWHLPWETWVQVRGRYVR